MKPRGLVGGENVSKYFKRKKEYKKEKKIRQKKNYTLGFS
jgi:hypothetical protein